MFNLELRLLSLLLLLILTFHMDIYISGILNYCILTLSNDRIIAMTINNARFTSHGNYISCILGKNSINDTAFYLSLSFNIIY